MKNVLLAILILGLIWGLFRNQSNDNSNLYMGRQYPDSTSEDYSRDTVYFYMEPQEAINFKEGDEVLTTISPNGERIYSATGHTSYEFLGKVK